MNRLFARRKHRKSRGVAVIFTLGILGLLTVMALGFASTALLNRKIAENSSVQTYARTIARNVALPRALFALRKGVPYGKIHSTKSTTNVNGDPDSSSTDFLWTLDTLLDSRKGPIIYATTTASGTDYTTSAEWQYVYSPVKQNPTDTKFPIIGRFAYVAFPDYGHMDPSVNLGSIDADKRYGSTEKELSLPIRSTDWNTQLKGKLENPNRWQSFNEIFSFLNIADGGSDDSRNMYQDGIGMNLSPASETFWVDLNKDGKQTKNEMFLRFNMTRDWSSTTVDQLIGEGAEPLTLNNAGASKSNTFIPWLKYANFSSDSDANTRMKKQIAANIIQYNLAESADTVSDVAPASWATAATGPTYAGIGQHPMLNELGFAVRIRSNVTETPEKIGEIQYYTYILTYYLYIDSGVELIYPFGPALSSSLSESIVDITGHVELDLMGFINQNEGESSSESDMSKIVKQYTLKTNSNTLTATGTDAAVVSIDWPTAGTGETFFKMTLPGSSPFWLDSTAYTSGWRFWKNNQTEPNAWASGAAAKEITFKFKIQSETSRKTDIENLIRVKSVKFCPGRVILKYGEKQRDYAELGDLTVFSGDQDVSGDQDTFFVSCYEAKDPLVNHYASDWTSPATPYIEKAWWFDYQNKYPGTILSGGNESHRNHPVPAEKLLEETINGTKIQETATDPAYTAGSRLSTSYIRHGQMKSLWELGFISRAEAFRTLNLAKTKIFVEPSAISDLKAGDFVDGDANILDQVKFSDTTSDDQLYKYGKVSLNSKNHNVLSQLFKNGVNWFEALSASAVTDQFTTTGTASTAVCSTSPCSESTCLAHLLKARCSILPFFNRSDLLLDPDDANFSQIPGYSSLRDEVKEPLKAAQTNLRNFLLKTTNDTLCKAEKEQYAARFMHLFSTEPVNRVYIIIVAQTIKDIGGVPAFVDWDCDGEFTPLTESNPTRSFPVSAKGLKSGYVRRKLDGSGLYEPVGGKTEEKETFTDTAIGTYDYGADKITGETKLIVEMQKDIFDDKWRIAGYRYVE